MQPTIYKTSKRPIEVYQANVILILLMMVSICATAYGFINMMSSEGPPAKPLLAAAIILSSSVALISAMSIRTYFIRSNPIFLMGSLSAMFVSVLLGQSFFSDQLNFIDSFVGKQLNNAEEQVLMEVEPVVETLNYQMRVLESLANHSIAQEKFEAKAENGGCYTRCKFRKANTATIELFYQQYKAKVDEINRLVNGMRNEKNQLKRSRFIKDLNRKLSQLASNDMFITFKNELTQMSAAWTNMEYTSVTPDGDTVIKKLWQDDPKFVELADAVILSLDTLKPVKLELNIIDLDNASLQRSAEVMIAVLMLEFDKVTPTDWFALVLALVVDLGVVYLSYIKSEMSWTASRVNNATRESDFKLSLVSNLLKFSRLNSGSELALLLERNAQDKSDHVVIRSKGCSHALELLCIKLEGMGIASKVVRSGPVQFFIGSFSKNTDVKLYKIPRNTFNQMKLAATQYDCEFMAAANTELKSSLI